MTRDIGIVLLPNEQCKNFVNYMREETTKIVPQTYKKLPNNPHVTLIHIANLNEERVAQLHVVFNKFKAKFSSCIALPIKGIKATGGSKEEGYKWLDLEFVIENANTLKEMRESSVDTFCSFHNGTLTRMYDDMARFNQEQKDDIEKCGVSFSKYQPHITIWYIDLPNEKKLVQLEEVANALSSQTTDLECKAVYISLVELGRNGNAIEVLEKHPLCDPLIHEDL